MDNKEHEFEDVEFEVFEMETEDGTMQEYAIMDEFDFEDQGYIIVGVVDGDKVDEPFYMLRCDIDGDERVLNEIEDDDEYTKVTEYYDSLEVEE